MVEIGGAIFGYMVLFVIGVFFLLIFLYACMFALAFLGFLVGGFYNLFNGKKNVQLPNS